MMMMLTWWSTSWSTLSEQHDDGVSALRSLMMVNMMMIMMMMKYVYGWRRRRRWCWCWCWGISKRCMRRSPTRCTRRIPKRNPFHGESVGWPMDVRWMSSGCPDAASQCFSRLGDDKLTSQDCGLRKASGRVTSLTLRQTSSCHTVISYSYDVMVCYGCGMLQVV
jgi:hypothetical protein